MDTKTEAKKEYRTSDLFLVAFLTVNQFKYVRRPSARPNSRYAVFCFENTEEIQHQVEKFLNREAVCEPLTLLETYRSIKTQAWDIKKGIIESEEVSHE
jgi:hypothetical protein